MAHHLPLWLAEAMPSVDAANARVRAALKAACGGTRMPVTVADVLVRYHSAMSARATVHADERARSSLVLARCTNGHEDFFAPNAVLTFVAQRVAPPAPLATLDAFLEPLTSVRAAGAAAVQAMQSWWCPSVPASVPAPAPPIRSAHRDPAPAAASASAPRLVLDDESGIWRCDTSAPAATTTTAPTATSPLRQPTRHDARANDAGTCGPCSINAERASLATWALTASKAALERGTAALKAAEDAGDARAAVDAAHAMFAALGVAAAGAHAAASVRSQVVLASLLRHLASGAGGSDGLEDDGSCTDDVAAVLRCGDAGIVSLCAASMVDLGQHQRALLAEAMGRACCCAADRGPAQCTRRLLDMLLGHKDFGREGVHSAECMGVFAFQDDVV